METQTQPRVQPTLTLIGVGGGGCTFLDHAIQKGLTDRETLAIDTDPLMLEKSKAHQKILLGNRSRRGLDGNSDPEKDKAAAEYVRTEISSTLQHSKLVILVSTLGGGAGSGAAPVVARLAKESGALTLALATQPFYFEGKRRARNSAHGETGLQNSADALVVLRNDQMLSRIDKHTCLGEAFRIIDDLLFHNIVGIIELYAADEGETLRAFWKRGNQTLLTSGAGHSAPMALQNAVDFNLTNLSLEKAQNILVQFTGKPLEPTEIETTRDLLGQYSNSEAKFFSHPSPNEEFQATLFANGFTLQKR
jgi:cell division protein FtsZ